ncbi:MAG TPA: CarD family transcriptional regulator [Bacillota bacterium]|nr:CarD family transcriptional regulator [Bacillota bacterium]
MNAESTKFNKGDCVMYKNSCVCRVEEIQNRSFTGIGERLFYNLRPVGDARTVFYVPADSPDLDSIMRQIQTPEEISEAISQSEKTKNIWIDDVKSRAIRFGELVSYGSTADVLWVGRALSDHRDAAQKEKRKLYASDARLLADAEKIITEEFSFALKLERDDVIPYIISLTRPQECAD